jgi:predicted nucleic acid-binding Zn ribbon protein
VNETGIVWARETAGVMSPLVHRLSSLLQGFDGQLLGFAKGAAFRGLEGGEVPTEPGGLEFILKASGLQILPPPLESVLKLPPYPEEPGFIEAWERLLLRHGLPVPLAPADPQRPHVVLVPLGILSCVRLFLETTLAAAEGRLEDMKGAISYFERAPGALRYLPHLVGPGVRPEDLASVDPTIPELRQEDLTTLTVAAIAREGNCSGFLSMVHRGASRFLSPPTRNRQILAWGWYPYLALVLATETPQRRCRRCGAPLPEGRRLFCSTRCSDTTRKAAYRARRRLKT